MRIAYYAFQLSGLLVVVSGVLVAQQPPSSGALARMPVKEVSIFKDGHAFVMHEGSMPTDASGNVVMDYLPAPILGTYSEVDLTGSIKVTNYRKDTVEVEVTREVLGTATSASSNGRVEKLNALAEYPVWWRYYSWPNWWSHFNGVGRVTWKIRIEARRHSTSLSASSSARVSR